MIIGKKVVAEAREWIGTPFRWGQSQKGVGCDCKGLIQGVARELGLEEAESFYAQIADYRQDRPVPASLLKEGMASVFKPGKKMMPGDILLCKFSGQAGHMAIYTGDDTAIHTQISSKAYVKETRLPVLFAYYPLDSVWRWRS